MSKQLADSDSCVQEFVDRCHTGEFRSVRTLQRFLNVLSGGVYEPPSEAEKLDMASQANFNAQRRD
jgi:hypothetical protein